MFAGPREDSKAVKKAKNICKQAGIKIPPNIYRNKDEDDLQVRHSPENVFTPENNFMPYSHQLVGLVCIGSAAETSTPEQSEACVDRNCEQWFAGGLQLIAGEARPVHACLLL